MTTRNPYLAPFKEKQQSSFGDSTNSEKDNVQYNNLNINQNHNNSSLSAQFLQSSKNTLNNQGEKDYDSTVFRQSGIVNKPFPSTPSNLMKRFDDDEKMEEQKRWKKEGSNSNATTKNSSTLSLHISAYENSIVNDCHQNDTATTQLQKQQDSGSKAQKNIRDFNSTVFNPFELPRQQKESCKSNEPEIMQFKASQKLLNPSETEKTGMTSEDMTGESMDKQKRIGFIRDALRLARDAVKRFEGNVSIQALKITTKVCSEGIKQVGNALHENLDGFGLLNIIAEIIHRILHIIKSQENITKLGQNNVIATVDRFIELIEEMMIKVGSCNATQTWIQTYSLENLSTAFPYSSCIVKKELTSAEIQAHSKLFLFKGDLLRYRCNILNEPYGASTKAYWMAFSLLPGQGIVFNLLGVIAASRDINDRLSQAFYFLRALSTTTPFEDAKSILLAKLEQVSQKMIKTDFVQHFEIFKDPSITDINGIYASTANPLRSDEYYFSWMPSASSISTTKSLLADNEKQQQQPKWKKKLAKFSRSMIFKMVTDNLFHMIHLLIIKESHSTLFATCERFLALTSYILETDEISGKELLQITTIFILALKSRDSCDESFEMLSMTFLHFIGLLFSKLYQILSQRKNDLNFLIEQKGMNILPSLVVVDSYWDSFEDKLTAAGSHLSRSYIFDFSIIRENVLKLGSLLNHYITNLNATVERVTTNDGVENDDNASSENTYLLPEIILCCLGSRFPVTTTPLKLFSIQKCSELFNTFVIRLFIAQELLSKMVKKEYFGIKHTFEYCPGVHDLCTFELFILAYQNEKPIYAIYPEYLIVDSVTLLETCEFLEEFAKYGIKIIVPNIVFAEIIFLSTNSQKPELFRATATKVKQIIIECIAKRADDFQVYDINGERKFRFSIDEIRGTSPPSPPQSSYGYPPILNKFNCILKIYTIVEELYAIKKPQMYGFYSPNIRMTKVLLLLADDPSASSTTSSSSSEQSPRRYGIPSISLAPFLEWFKSSTGSKIFTSNNGDESFKRTFAADGNNNNSFENYFSVPSDTNQRDIIYDEYNLFELFKNEISAVVDEKNERKRYPIRAQQDVSAIGVQIYPVGVIPPHYISRSGKWTEPGTTAATTVDLNSSDQLYSYYTSSDDN